MIKRIMIVDDSPIIHSVMKKTLLANGYEVCGDAKNGVEAVEMYQELKPDLVFLDITMPIMDGIETLAKIKERHKSAKIVMLTAMGDDEIVESAKNLGANVFLKKPFDELKVLRAISTIEGNL